MWFESWKKKEKLMKKRLKIHPVCIRLVYLFLHSSLEEFVGPLNCSKYTDVFLAQSTTELTKNSLKTKWYSMAFQSTC